jgi:hypothetical protein
MLVANGTVAPLYIETKQKISTDLILPKTEGHIEYLPQKTNRRGERGMLACLEYQKTTNFFCVGDILLSDAEAALHTEWVRDFLTSLGVSKYVFPKGLGHLMNPCDNCFHGEVKKRYYSALAGEGTSQLSFERKIQLIKQAYYGGSEESIKNYFKHTGILGTQNPIDVMANLLYEGIYPSEEWTDFHEKQLQYYQNWWQIEEK